MAALMLCGCNPLMIASLTNLKSATVGPDELDVSAAQVAEVNYPQLKLTTPSGSGVLALVRERDDLQFWVASGKQVSVAARRSGGAQHRSRPGRRSGRDASCRRSPFKKGLHQVPRWLHQPALDRSLPRSGSRGDVEQSLLAQIHGNPRNPQQGIRVLRVDEQIDAPAIGLRATNRYWVDPVDGFIVQSEQQLTSQLRVKIVQLTPDRRHAR
jgi:hypothetical protein